MTTSRRHWHASSRGSAVKSLPPETSQEGSARPASSLSTCFLVCRVHEDEISPQEAKRLNRFRPASGRTPGLAAGSSQRTSAPGASAALCPCRPPSTPARLLCSRGAAPARPSRSQAHPPRPSKSLSCCLQLVIPLSSHSPTYHDRGSCQGKLSLGRGGPW